MKHLLRPDYLQLLIYPNTLKPILRLNPSLLLISSKYTNLTHLYSIDNKRKTSKINSCHIYELNQYNVKIEEYNTNTFQKDQQYKILDITDLDFNWNYFNPDKLMNKNKEYLDEIHTELNHMCKHFEINEKLDGYHIKHKLFLFFD